MTWNPGRERERASQVITGWLNQGAAARTTSLLNFGSVQLPQT